jgi:5,10-methylene-tetrahydrofolate dehydrogenase/methenyl tetrahydrofolate cyclohydrolase
MCDLFGNSAYLVADIVVAAVGQQHCHLAKWIDQKGTSAIDI